MTKFMSHEGLAAPLDRVNVDTDAIIPKQFLKSIKRTGFGVNLFDEWRYLDVGEIGQDISQRTINPDFVLNKAQYKGASILLCRQNFGCGSSREHAAWALEDYGIKVLIGPSFADIFYNNAIKNGLLPIVLEESIVDALFGIAQSDSGLKITIDLVSQVVKTDAGEEYSFNIAPAKKAALVKGLDEIGLTLEHSNQIKLYEAKRRKEKPWLFDQVK